MSAVRAGIMAGFMILCQYFGRTISPRIIFFAGALMLFSNPFLLRWDPGFQLSFLAMLGIVYLQPTLSYFLKKIPNNLFSLRTALSASLAAQIFTTPVLIYSFGRFSLLSVFANLPIVPLLAPATILIFVFGILGMFFHSLGWILSWPIWLLLTYIVRVIDFFYNMPFSSLLLEISWIWIPICYFILGLAIYYLKKRQRFNFLI